MILHFMDSYPALNEPMTPSGELLGYLGAYSVHDLAHHSQGNNKLFLAKKRSSKRELERTQNGTQTDSRDMCCFLLKAGFFFLVLN